MLGVGEATLSVVAGAIAEPIAGIAGIAQAVNPFAAPGAGARAVKDTKDFIASFTQPSTEAGKKSLAAFGETMAPVGEAIKSAEKFLGDTTFEETDSPALAALAATIPTALMEVLGLGVGRVVAKGVQKLGPSKREINRAIVDSAPNIEQLKDAARGVYKELDNSGVRIRADRYEQLVNKIAVATKKEGLDFRVTPRAAGAIDILRDSVGRAPSLTEIDTLRKVAQKVAKNIDPTESSLGVQIISELDDFLDGISAKDLSASGIDPTKISPKYNAARQLWGRARRSETITDAIDKGSRAASGLENGIRSEFNRIINSKKSKFFPKEELASMQAVVDGDFTKNILKHVGKFGISIDRSGSNLLAFLGGAGGFAAGGAGPGAGVVALGTAARSLGKQLAKREAAFIDDITRAGKNATKITEAYLRVFPKSKRTAADLSTLFTDPSIDISGLLRSSNKLKREAAEMAEGRRAIGSALGAMAAPTSTEQQGQATFKEQQ